MQIKGFDDRREWVDELRHLLVRPDVTDATRQRIEHEIRSIKAGADAERQAAYLIEFWAGANPNVMTLHGLRITCGGRVAQIDHLIVTRPFDLWACESKRFSERVEINELGEWTAYYNGNPRGLPSPIEQNRRHAAVLKDVFVRRLVVLPSRNGHELEPRIRSLVLVSDRTHISRPTGPAAKGISGLDTVIKVDLLKVRINAAHTAGAREVALSHDELERVARQLAGLHAPSSIDWPRRFGLAAGDHRAPPLAKGSTLPTVRISELRPSRAVGNGAVPLCSLCCDHLSPGVVDYCRDNRDVFGGRLFCMSCQDDFFPYRYP